MPFMDDPWDLPASEFFNLVWTTTSVKWKDIQIPTKWTLELYEDDQSEKRHRLQVISIEEIGNKTVLNFEEPRLSLKKIK